MKVIHYVNQFFGGVGGEDHANDPPHVVDGAVGPGRALNAALGDSGSVLATIVCGDNYFVENEAEAESFVAERHVGKVSAGRCRRRSCVRFRTLRFGLRI